MNRIADQRGHASTRPPRRGAQGVEIRFPQIYLSFHHRFHICHFILLMTYIKPSFSLSPIAGSSRPWRRVDALKFEVLSRQG